MRGPKAIESISDFQIVGYDEVMQAMAQSNERRETSPNKRLIPSGTMCGNRKAPINFSKQPQKAIANRPVIGRHFGEPTISLV